MEPRVELIEPPKGYGEATEPLAWATVRQELESARQYWLTILRTEGSPHVVPLDGQWIDDAWYFGGSPETLHQKLIRKHRHVTMHLPDAWRRVVVEGEVRVSKTSPEKAKTLAAAFTAKYPEYGTADPVHYGEVAALHPKRVIAWTSFPADMTRFLFT